MEGRAFGETSASYGSSSNGGGSSDLSCNPGMGTFRALETMSVLTEASTRRYKYTYMLSSETLIINLVLWRIKNDFSVLFMFAAF